MKQLVVPIWGASFQPFSAKSFEKSHIQHSMMYEFCALTDQGLVRKNNEDMVAFD